MNFFSDLKSFSWSLEQDIATIFETNYIKFYHIVSNSNLYEKSLIFSLSTILPLGYWEDFNDQETSTLKEIQEACLKIKPNQTRKL